MSIAQFTFPTVNWPKLTNYILKEQFRTKLIKQKKYRCIILCSNNKMFVL